MKQTRQLPRISSFALVITLLIGAISINVAALDTWNDASDFFDSSNTYITAKAPGTGDGGTVYGLWNTSSPLTGNWTASAKVTMDMAVLQAEHSVGQRPALLLGDATDPEAEPSLVALLDLQYFNENNGKIWSIFQYYNGSAWVSSPAQVNTWPTDLGNEFIFEIAKISDTVVHVKLTSVDTSTDLIDMDITVGIDAMGMIKSFGIGTRTGFEAFTVPAGESWVDPTDFYTVPRNSIVAESVGTGDGGTVYGMWNTSAPLTGNWTTSTKVTMDMAVLQAEHSVGQRPALLLGDATDPEAEPALVALLDLQYFNENNGKIWSIFQYYNGSAWVSSPAQVNTWPTDLGNEFIFEIAKISDTVVHVKLTSVDTSTDLIDMDITVGIDAMGMIKSYGIGTRTGFETFTEMMPVAPDPTPTTEATPTTGATPTESPNPQTGSSSNSSLSITLIIISLGIILSTSKRIFIKS